MTPFHRTARLRIDQHLAYRGSGTIEAALFDLGIYPAAVPVSGERVHGELYEMRHPTIVLRALNQKVACSKSACVTPKNRRSNAKW